MKKKVMLIVTAAALIVLLTAGATLAWFTDSKEVNNVITMGNISASLEETLLDKDGNPVVKKDEDGNPVVDEDGNPVYEKTDNNEYTDVIPGDVIPKDPTLTLDEKSAKAWVRYTVKVTFIRDCCIPMAFPDYSILTFTKGSEKVELEFDKSGFAEFYMPEIMNPGESYELFDSVYFDGAKMTDKYQNGKVAIDVKADIIQSDNLKKADGTQVTTAEEAFTIFDAE